MSDPTSLEAEIDVLMEEMRDWEQGMAYEWTEADRCSFLEKKRDTIKNFFMNEVAAAERKSSNTGASEDAFVKEQAKRQEEEAKLALAKAAEEEARLRAEEAARKAAEEDAIEAEVRRQMEEEELIRKRIAAEEAELEAEVRRQMEAEENAVRQLEAEERAAKDADRLAREREEAQKAQEAARAAAAKEAAAKEAAAKEAAAREAAARETARISSTPASPAVPPAAELDDSELDAALEKEYKDALLRITRAPVGRQADLTDPSVIATYMKLRNDRVDLNWMILGYPSDSTPNKITVLGCGSGGWAEMMPQIPHEPIYIYLNYRFGDTGRAKFVFMTYVPDNLPGMKKSRVLGHRPAVEKLLKYMQLSWHVLDYNEFSEETLQKRLLAIGGANYSVQESDKGNFSSYKNTTKQFYSETEKKSSIGPVVYQTGPLTTTPMDISGRSMVAAPSDFRANIIDLK